MLKAVQQGKLIDKDGGKRQAAHRARDRAGIVNLFIFLDEFSPRKGFFGLVHDDSSPKVAEKTSLFSTFTEF